MFGPDAVSEGRRKRKSPTQARAEREELITKDDLEPAKKPRLGQSVMNQIRSKKTKQVRIRSDLDRDDDEEAFNPRAVDVEFLSDMALTSKYSDYMLHHVVVKDLVTFQQSLPVVARAATPRRRKLNSAVASVRSSPRFQNQRTTSPQSRQGGRTSPRTQGVHTSPRGGQA